MKAGQCPKKQTHFKANQTQFKPIQSHRRGWSCQSSSLIEAPLQDELGDPTKSDPPSFKTSARQAKSNLIRLNPTKKTKALSRRPWGNAASMTDEEVKIIYWFAGRAGFRLWAT
jgi:hypothetical protein